MGLAASGRRWIWACAPWCGCSSRARSAPSSRVITVRKTIDGIIATACIATACIEAKLPLVFSDRDLLPYVEHLGLEAETGVAPPVAEKRD
jgi:hypothetical protein